MTLVKCRLGYSYLNLEVIKLTNQWKLWNFPAF